MTKDPLIYRVLAVGNLLIFGSFLIAYTRTILRDREGSLRERIKAIELFALGLLVLFFAVFVYQLLPFLRQFYGESYWGRNQVRIFASVLLMLSGGVMHYVLWRTRRNRKDAS